MKVTVVGAGNVGATTAQRIFDRGYSRSINPSSRW